MSDYIKREDAVIEIERFGGYLDDDMLYRIKLALGRLPSADVVEGAACKECRFRNVCQQEIKMLGPGIVYECGFGIEGCSLGKRIEGEDDD